MHNAGGKLLVAFDGDMYMLRYPRGCSTSTSEGIERNHGAMTSIGHVRWFWRDVLVAGQAIQEQTGEEVQISREWNKPKTSFIVGTIYSKSLYISLYISIMGH